MRYTAEAEKIRWTYLAELEARLRSVTPDERLEMVEEIRDHLDEAAREFETDLIDGAEMRDLINRVGNVEVLSIAVDGDDRESAAQPAAIKVEASKAFTAQWEGESHGHVIRVVNKYNLLLFGSGHLYVDDELLAEDRGWLNYSSTLTATISRDGETKLSLRARLADERGEGNFFDRMQSQGVVCRVWVNKEPIVMELIEG